jgi:beta-glucosidase
VRRFPDGFLWGVSTSAYQVEGAVDVDGRGRSIWDTFSHTPGKVENGDTGDVACDHYQRLESDLDLLPELGVNAYRFSIAWPRLFPDGRGRVERRGLDHYDRLIDGLLERGVEPVVTLYHWDLPQALEDEGGWLSRDTVEAFAEYTATCFAAYGDRVRWWVTQNEPWIIGVLGYQLGIHAPGMTDLRASVEAMHNVLLAHGRAVQELRAGGTGGKVGAAFSLFPNYPATDTDADREAARLSGEYVNRWFLDPVLKGSYPDDMRALYEERVGPLQLDGLDTIATPSDFVGVNYYTRRVMRAAPGREPFPWDVEPARPGVPVTDVGWEIVPECLTDLLMTLKQEYGDVPVLILENGGVFEDAVHDEGRIDLIRGHLAAVRDAIEQGVDVRGYCHWSLMDNFEWAMGYRARFGLVHVDYETQARTVKDSGRYYAQVARANGLEDE